MLIFLVDGVLQTPILPTMFYPQVDMLFVTLTALCPWYGAVNFKQRLRCQPPKQNILLCLTLCMKQFWSRTLWKISIAFLICKIWSLIFCITCHEDNLSAIVMAESLKFTPQTKTYCNQNHHFWSRVQTYVNKSGDIKIKYILSKLQLADIFTQPLENESFIRCPNMLCG